MSRPTGTLWQRCLRAQMRVFALHARADMEWFSQYGGSRFSTAVNCAVFYYETAITYRNLAGGISPAPSVLNPQIPTQEHSCPPSTVPPVPSNDDPKILNCEAESRAGGIPLPV